MLRNYFKTALRSLWKKRGFTLLNVLGLSLGLACFMLILQYVSFELSFEDFHENHENLYRIDLQQYNNGNLAAHTAENYPGLAQVLKETSPEVLAITRMYNLGSKNQIVVSYDDAPGQPKEFNQSRLLYAEANFLEMFDFPVANGNPATSFQEPFKMLISASCAEKYFGEEDPIGKFLHLRDDDFNDELCEVIGVLEDVPANSHIKFDILISYPTLYARGDWAEPRYSHSWRRRDMYTYVQLKPGTDPAIIEARLPDLITKHKPDLEAANSEEIMSLQPITDIHLYSHLSDEPEMHGDGDSVYFLLIIAIFLLVIAYVNYINLSTSRSLERANEVGIRKVMGAHRGQLVRQFLFESFWVNLIAMLLALILLEVSQPFFNRLAGFNLEENEGIAFLWQRGSFWLLIPGLLLAGTLFSGLYPALVLSAFMPVTVLSGKLRNSKQGILFRKGLVVFQFAICIALIVGTITVYRQLNFMKQQDLGFSTEQILVIERPGVGIRDFDKYVEVIESFKNELTTNPKIKSAAIAGSIPGKRARWKSTIRNFGAESESPITANFSWGDYDLFQTLDMEIIAGRNFSRDHSLDRDTACILTESAVLALGYASAEEIVGKQIHVLNFEEDYVVVGVAKDYQQESPKYAPEPTFIDLREHWGEYYLIKVNTQELNTTIAEIESAWYQHFPGNPYHYYFLDEFYDAQYRFDQRFGQLFSLFSFLAIIIGCLGLFGLSSYTIQARYKEIGVRKVLGASVLDILKLISKEFVQLILISTLLAWPLVGYLMHQWLQGYASRVSLSWWSFAISGILVLVLAVATVSLQAMKAASANPADSIRTE